MACSYKDRERFGLEQCKLHELPVDDWGWGKNIKIQELFDGLAVNPLLQINNQSVNK